MLPTRPLVLPSLSLLLLPLGVSFLLFFRSSPYLVLVLRELIIHHGRKERVSTTLLLSEKKMTMTFRFGYWSKRSTMLVSRLVYFTYYTLIKTY